MAKNVGEVRRVGLRPFAEALGSGTSYKAMADENEHGRVRAHAVQTILASPLEVYEMWMDVVSIRLWQERVKSVTIKGDGLTHWVLQPDPDKEEYLEFDSEMVEDKAGERIAWRMVPGSASEDGYDESGEVRFEERPWRGTRVTLVHTFQIPGGGLAEAIYSLKERSHKMTVAENLRHLKQMIEAGEIPIVDPDVHGPRGASGGMRQFLYGEKNPVPAGTTEAA